MFKRLINKEVRSFKKLILGCGVLLSSSADAGDYFKSDEMVFDFYSPNWANGGNGVKSIANKSFGFSFSWGKDNPFKKSKFSYYYGLGYDYNLYHHNAQLKKPVEIVGHPNDFEWFAINSNYDFNKLKNHTVFVPLEIRFRTQTKIPFRVYAGVRVGYLFKSTYQNQNQMGELYERKYLKELNPIRYGATFRVGYGMFNLYSYYGLNSLIKPSAGQPINEFAIGISLLAN